MAVVGEWGLGGSDSDDGSDGDGDGSGWRGGERRATTTATADSDSRRDSSRRATAFDDWARRTPSLTREKGSEKDSGWGLV